MLLQHAKLLAFNHGGKAIKDCVITVPSSFTQHEKSAVFTAASIADLNILTLIEENTAAALQYGIDKVHETPTNVLYYNMGAEGVQVRCVASLTRCQQFLKCIDQALNFIISVLGYYCDVLIIHCQRKWKE